MSTNLASDDTHAHVSVAVRRGPRGPNGRGCEVALIPPGSAPQHLPVAGRGAFRICLGSDGVISEPVLAPLPEIISYSPKALGCLVPTGRGAPFEFFAFYEPSSRLGSARVELPPRAAYSHSAWVGNLYA